MSIDYVNPYSLYGDIMPSSYDSLDQSGVNPYAIGPMSVFGTNLDNPAYFNSWENNIVGQQRLYETQGNVSNSVYIKNIESKQLSDNIVRMVAENRKEQIMEQFHKLEQAIAARPGNKNFTKDQIRNMALNEFRMNTGKDLIQIVDENCSGAFVNGLNRGFLGGLLADNKNSDDIKAELTGTRREAGSKTAEVLGTTAGGAATGAAIGAGVGAIFGGIGAAPGAVAGAIIGGTIGFVKGLFQ